MKRNPFDVIGQLGALRRYARSLTRNAEDAEDLVHDALVNAYERKATFRTGASVRNWLMSILHNTHIDRLRRRQSAERRNADVAPVARPRPAAFLRGRAAADIPFETDWRRRR